jgi:hypothetical protein
MAAKLTRLTHKIATQLHLVVQSSTICSSRSRRTVRKLLDALSYVELGPRFVFHQRNIPQRVFWVVTPCSDVVGYQHMGGPSYHHLHGYFNLRMEAARSSGTMASYYTTIWSHDLDCNLNLHRHGNLKYHILLHVKNVCSVAWLSKYYISLCTLQVMHLLQKGNRARTVEPTAANETSSRSHALLSVTVRQTSLLQPPEQMRSRIKRGKLFMIDLAGSERASQTKVTTQLIWVPVCH